MNPTMTSMALREAVQREDLAADVHVQALEVDARQLDRALDRLHRQSLVQAEAELGVLGAGLMKSCVSASTPGRDADQDRLRDAALRRHRRETVHLLEAVDDDAPDAGVEALGELGRRLVVAVHVDALHREAGAQGERELAAARAHRGSSPPRRRCWHIASDMNALPA